MAISVAFAAVAEFNTQKTKQKRKKKKVFCLFESLDVVNFSWKFGLCRQLIPKLFRAADLLVQV